jgi:hypothetical protein
MTSARTPYGPQASVASEAAYGPTADLDLREHESGGCHQSAIGARRSGMCRSSGRAVSSGNLMHRWYSAVNEERSKWYQMDASTATAVAAIGARYQLGSALSRRMAAPSG